GRLASVDLLCLAGGDGLLPHQGPACGGGRGVGPDSGELPAGAVALRPVPVARQGIGAAPTADPGGPPGAGGLPAGGLVLEVVPPDLCSPDGRHLGAGRGG